VMKVTQTGGAPTILAVGQTELGNVAVDALNVYWIASGDGTVMMTPK
jgi:hypothetical protein